MMRVWKRGGWSCPAMSVAGVVLLTATSSLSGAATLALQFDKTCYKPGDTVTATLSMSGLPSPAAGFQAFLSYDTAHLTWVSTTLTPSPFGQVILPGIPSSGNIDVASGVNASGGQTPTMADATLVTITFVAAGPDVCSLSSALIFRNTGADPPNPQTRITNTLGAALLPLTKIDAQTVGIDGEAPTISCPSLVALACNQPLPPTDFAGGSAADNCGSPTVTWEGDSKSGNTCATRVTTRTYKATDACGNSATCNQTITGGIVAGPATLTLAFDRECYKSGDTVYATLSMSNLGTAAAGFQAFLSYDTSHLTWVSTTYTPIPFGLTILPGIPLGGNIDVASGINQLGGQTPSQADALLVTFVFSAGGPDDCDVSNALFFRNTGADPPNPPTRITDTYANPLLPLTLNDADSVAFDSTPPVFDNCEDGNTDLGCNPVSIPGCDTGVTAHANCGTAEVTCEPSDSASGCHHTRTLVYTATACSGTSVCTRTYTWTVNTAPVFSNCVNGSQDLGCNPASLPVCDGSITAHDECGNVPVTCDGGTDSVIGCQHSRTFVFTATSCGGTSTCSRTYTWNAATAPVFDNCSSSSTDLGCNPAGVPTCATAPSVAAHNECGPVSVTCDGGTDSVSGCNHTRTLTYTATACGLTSTCPRTYTWKVDTTAPVITPPSDISVDADAGGCTANVALSATANDACDGPRPVVFKLGATVITSPHVFSQGTTAVTVESTDLCGNTGSAGFNVTVSSISKLAVAVELSPNISPVGALSRCITFELWSCSPVTGPIEINQVLNFNVTAGVPYNSAVANAVIDVPCGAYSCITARDRLHTLRRSVSMGISGAQYIASFTGDVASGGDWLIGGNLNDDEYVDILDFGVFTFQYNVNYGTANTTCATPSPNADISGDGKVFTQDFTFIQVNFLKINEANCCGQPNLALSNGPITDISVAELRAMGLGHLAVADLNRDGRVNQLDVALFMQGVRPRNAAKENQ